MARILLIDDDRSLREVVSFILTEAGHEVLTAADGRLGIERHDEDLPDLVLTDIRMPGADGMEVLRHVRDAQRVPVVPVIVLTAYGTVEQAVAAMQGGAFTYLLKPFNRDELRLTVERALRTRALEMDNLNLRSLLRERSAESPLLFASQVMDSLMKQIRRVAPADVAVLISGESGTGKELIARALHDLSPRWDKPLVTVDCGAIPADLMESELFGHARGAFTGAHAAFAGRIRAAAAGSLFLDEIGELPLPLQPKLLRVLETKTVQPLGESRSVPVDFRLICATNRDLTAAVEAGRFREDLYYRLEVVHLMVPPLRERPEDIPVLWEHFTRLHGAENVRSSPELMDLLARRPWPGNVRELKNLSQRLLVLRRGDLLSANDLTRVTAWPVGRQTGPVDTEGGAAGAEIPLGPLPDAGLSLPELEKEVIRRVLVRCEGNKSRAAAYLGIPRHVLIYRLKKYGL